MRFSTKPSRRETVFGGIYLSLYISVLPWLVPVLLYLLVPQLDQVQVNLVYFILNFAATTLIFRKYLIQSLKDALKVPGAVIWYGILGYLGSNALGGFVSSLIYRLDPGFANVNDMVIGAMVNENFAMMAVGVVILAPIAEELLFRGLIFRGLYDRSPLAAHLVTMVLFSAIHVSGYIGLYPPKTLILCFIQYLPVAYCMNFAYRYSGSIVSPMLLHMLNNLAALSAMR